LSGIKKRNGNRKEGKIEVVEVCLFAAMEDMQCVLKVTITFLLTYFMEQSPS